jgi:DNA-binding GntR family transcriptional regulator
MTTPLRTVSTPAALEAVLADRILDGDLAPGAHLIEADLTADYEVARHSLRAACDGLVRRGLLVKKANRGFFVPELTQDDVREIFELRRALEAPVVRALAQQSNVPEVTTVALERLRALPDDAPWRDVVRADLDYHRGLVAAGGNERVARVHDDLLAEIALCIVQTGWSYETPAEVAHEHDRLAGAIRSGDPEAAERELDWHFGQGLARLRERS